MERQEMALALADIFEYQRIIREAEIAYAALSHEEPYSAGLVITSAELQEAARFENQKNDARLHLEQHQERMGKSISQFLAALPNSILKEMRDEGKAVFASWTTEQVPAQKYGPFAAFFSGEALMVERFENLEDFKIQFQLRRDQETTAFSDDNDL